MFWVIMSFNIAIKDSALNDQTLLTRTMIVKWGFTLKVGIETLHEFLLFRYICWMNSVGLSLLCVNDLDRLLKTLFINSVSATKSSLSGLLNPDSSYQENNLWFTKASELVKHD